MEVGLVVGIIGFALIVLLALGAWKGRVKKVLDGLAALSFVYSSLELFRYVAEYIRVTETGFPSIFHVELLLVGFAPVYFMVKELAKKYIARNRLSENPSAPTTPLETMYYMDPDFAEKQIGKREWWVRDEGDSAYHYTFTAT